MLSVKQARFLTRGLSKIGGGIKKAATSDAAFGIGLGAAHLGEQVAKGVAATYLWRSAGRATFGARKKNQMSVEQFNQKLKTKGFFGRGRMYNRVRRGTIKLQGSSVIRPFAGTAGIKGAMYPLRPTLRPRP